MTALQANGVPGAVGNGGTWARERLNLLSENSYTAPPQTKKPAGATGGFLRLRTGRMPAPPASWLAPYSWAKPWRRA